MKLLVKFAILLAGLLLPNMMLAQNSLKIYINEVRVNSTGETDMLEFVEFIGPAGASFSGYIYYRNGNVTINGHQWQHPTSFTIPADCETATPGDSIGFFVVGAADVLNVDDSNNWRNMIPNGPGGLFVSDIFSGDIEAIAWGGGGEIANDSRFALITTGSPTTDNYLHIIPHT